MQFHFHANQSHFHKNGFTLRLALKERRKGTRKWPIVLVSSNKSDRKGKNKVSKGKLKKYSFGTKMKEKPVNFPARRLLLIVL